MKQILTYIFIFFASAAIGQDFEQLSKEILTEGIELYRNERASWISTDSVPESNRELVNGYFTYKNGENYISIYVDKTDKNAVYKFTFQPVGDLEIELTQTERNVPLSATELNILKVRKKAVGLSSMWYQQFGYTQIVNLISLFIELFLNLLFMSFQERSKMVYCQLEEI